MPFGLTNAPATFQRLMKCALAGLTNEECPNYLDDIIIFSHSFTEHLQHLRNTFLTLRQVHLQVKLLKCAFASPTVHYLEHVVSASGVTPDPHKTEAVSQYPIPTNIKELKQFLGLTNYYRKFIYNYAYITDPLSKQLQGHKKHFQWSSSCQQAFDNLKSKLIMSPISSTQILLLHLCFILMLRIQQLVQYSVNFRITRKLLLAIGAIS